MGFQTLPMDLFEDILQDVFESTWRAGHKWHFLWLRTIDRRSDEIISRMAFEALNPSKFRKRRKPPSRFIVQWLLFAKACSVEGSIDESLSKIYTPVSNLLRPNIWKTALTGSHRDYLRGACCLVTFQRNVQDTLSTLIYPDDVSDYVSPSGTEGPLDGTLQLAANHGVGHVVSELIALGIDPNSAHSALGYALHAAAHGGHADIVSLLLRNGADVNQKDSVFGRPPILVAAQMGRKDVVEFLLSNPETRPGNPSFDGHTTLIWAVKWGWTDVVQSLLSRPDIDPNAKAKLEDTPLAAAVRGGFDEIFNLLMQRSDLQPTFRGGKFCPLWIAIHNSASAQVIRLLDRFSFNPNTVLRHGNTLLCKALELQGDGLARMLLERKDVDPNFTASWKHHTPLYWAFYSSDIMKLLIERPDLDPNRPSKGLRPLEIAVANDDMRALELLLSRPDTRTDLHGGAASVLNEAAAEGKLEIVRRLLQRPGNDPNQRSRLRGPPLCEAIGNRRSAIVRELLKLKEINPNLPWQHPGARESPLCLAIRKRFRGVVESLLLRDDIDINQISDKRTALCVAFDSEDTDQLELLLRREEIDINITGPEGTALAVATRALYDSRFKVGLLLKRPEIDVNRMSTMCRRERQMVLRRISTTDQSYPITYGKFWKRYYTQCAPLHEAVKRYDFQLIKLFLEHPQIDHRLPDGLKRTPLWWASYTGNKRVAKAILALGENNVNAQDIFGWSPLLLATNWRDIDMAELLLKQPGIDPNLANHENWTPLHLAVQAGYAGMVELILTNPATDPRKQLQFGLTPIDIAKKHGFDAMATDLRRHLRKLQASEAAAKNDVNSTVPLPYSLTPTVPL